MPAPVLNRVQGLRVLLIDEQPSCTAIRTQLEQPELSYAGESRPWL
jgi:hypothetical protein